MFTSHCTCFDCYNGDSWKQRIVCIMKDLCGMYTVLFISDHMFWLLMVIPENKDCKYYERLSVMYCIVYFSSHLLIVNGWFLKTKEVSIMKDSFDC